MEDAYWKTNFSKQKYVDADVPYSNYQAAYRTGYEGWSKYPGKKYEEVEADLRRNYEQGKGNGGLAWDKARPATRDAWNRVNRSLSADADVKGR